MDLTAAQKTTLKNAIAANTTQILNPTTNQTVQIKDITIDDGGGANAIATWYNLPCTTDFFANYSTVPVSAVKGAIIWKNLTPKDAIPTDTALNVAIWNGRANMCAACQFNIQMLLTPSSQPGATPTVDATQARVVTGFKDALSAVPSDTAGAAQDAGATNVQKVLCRKSSNLEKLFADTSGANGSTNLLAATLVLDSTLSPLTGSDVFAARNS